MFGLPAIIGGIGLGLDTAFKLYEGRENRKAQEDINDKNAALQREFAQMGIRWKVEDAKAAGLHPLAALGASTVGFSPSYQMGAGYNVSDSVSFSKMGQDISRAVMAAQSERERTEDLLNEIKLERLSAQNDILRSQLARKNSAQVGPGVPLPEGPIADTQKWITSDNVVYEGPSVEWAQAHQGLPGSTIGYYLRNNLWPTVVHGPDMGLKWAVDHGRYFLGNRVRPSNRRRK